VPFVDPRILHVAAVLPPRLEPTERPEDVVELHRLCREGRLYEVERWLVEGKPVQVAESVSSRSLTTALGIALERDNHSLVVLLLSNGYDPDVEPQSPLDIALRNRRWEYVDLLLEYGADPKRVDVEVLFDTYSSQLFERFWALGVDMTSRHDIAYSLTEHTSNKPLFGFVKRHLADDPKFQTELDIALAHHAGEGNEKGALLCLWAGANPHTPVQILRYYSSSAAESDNEQDEDELRSSAIYEACQRGSASILAKLRPDPVLDNFDELYRSASDPQVIALLAKIAPPRKADTAISFKIHQISWRFEDTGRTLDALRRFFEVGARWVTSAPEDLAYTRRSLLKMSDSTFVDLMRLLSLDDYCSTHILKELGRTPSMRARMKKVGFIPGDRDAQDSFSYYRPSRSREVLVKFGVEAVKSNSPLKPRLARSVEIGTGSRTIRLDRRRLFDLVWSTPIDRLATDWGMSGRGLAKACRRLLIPVPPRGYWAKAAAGKTVGRPKLPSLKTGETEEVVIRVSEGAPL
jgi:hypothetical protein